MFRDKQKMKRKDTSQERFLSRQSRSPEAGLKQNVALGGVGNDVANRVRRDCRSQMKNAAMRVARTCCGAFRVFSRGMSPKVRNGYVTRALDAFGPFFQSRLSRPWCPSMKLASSMCLRSLNGVLLSLVFGRRAPA